MRGGDQRLEKLSQSLPAPTTTTGYPVDQSLQIPSSTVDYHRLQSDHWKRFQFMKITLDVFYGRPGEILLPGPPDRFAGGSKIEPILTPRRISTQLQNQIKTSHALFENEDHFRVRRQLPRHDSRSRGF